MILSDRDLIRMFPDSNPEPASIDLHIGDTLKYWPNWVRRDPRIDQSDMWREVPIDKQVGGWVLIPGIRYLAATRERLKILDDHAGELTGRSSWGRDGLEIHRTAGWIDPGFEGNPTLELSVVGSELILWPGAKVCQLILHQLSSPCLLPYTGKYQSNIEPTPSRSHLDGVVYGKTDQQFDVRSTERRATEEERGLRTLHDPTQDQQEEADPTRSLLPVASRTRRPVSDCHGISDRLEARQDQPQERLG